MDVITALATTFCGVVRIKQSSQSFAAHMYRDTKEVYLMYIIILQEHCLTGLMRQDILYKTKKEIGVFVDLIISIKRSLKSIFRICLYIIMTETDSVMCQHIS